MSGRPEVVVVDGLRETTEVLRAILEPRGMQVLRQSSTASRPQSESDRLQVLVLHEHPPAGTSGSRVLVGRISPGQESRQAPCRTLPQPFDYGDLIDAIHAAVEAPLTA